MLGCEWSPFLWISDLAKRPECSFIGGHSDEIPGFGSQKRGGGGEGGGPTGWQTGEEAGRHNCCKQTWGSQEERGGVWLLAMG